MLLAIVNGRLHKRIRIEAQGQAKAEGFLILGLGLSNRLAPSSQHVVAVLVIPRVHR